MLLEFYYRFSKQYSRKVKELLIDFKRIFKIERIKESNNFEICLDEKYKEGLKDNDWLRLNMYHYILFNTDDLPPVLQKFINNKDTNKNKKYKFIDTFSGCGGLSLGLENAGFSPVLINEIEPKYLVTHYFNHTVSIDNYHCGDIKDLIDSNFKKKELFKDIDLLVGGPPCQGFSMANRQRILDDPRNQLYRYFLDLLGIVRPKVFVMENVKGMVKKSKEIIENFYNKLGDEYSIDIVLLNAKDYGIPQNRERVFVIGSKLEHTHANQITYNILSKKSSFKERSLGEALIGLPQLGVKKVKNAPHLENEEIGYKFRKGEIKKDAYSKYINGKNDNKYIFNHKNRYNNERDIEIFARLPQGANSLHKSIKDIMPYSKRNGMFKDKYFKLDSKKVSKTITSHMKFDCNMYIHPTQSRGLSPREAGRIQTFPDDYVFMGSHNNRYAQIGNAVPVKLAEVIGKEIIRHL